MNAMTPREFRTRWPSIASIPCVKDVLGEWEDSEKRAFERVTALRLALRDLLDAIGDEPCRLDHHGNCQAHFLGNPCEVAAARTALEVG